MEAFTHLTVSSDNSTSNKILVYCQERELNVRLSHTFFCIKPEGQLVCFLRQTWGNLGCLLSQDCLDTRPPSFPVLPGLARHEHVSLSVKGCGLEIDAITHTQIVLLFSYFTLVFLYSGISFFCSGISFTMAFVLLWYLLYCGISFTRACL